MAITLICPNLLCRGVLQVPDNVRGRKVRCGKCGKDFMVPAVTGKGSKPAATAKAPSEPADKAASV